MDRKGISLSQEKLHKKIAENTEKLYEKKGRKKGNI
jgi:hypothetical protein